MRPDLIRVAGGILRQDVEADRRARIGAEQLDRAMLALGVVDHALDVGFLGDVALVGRATDRFGDDRCIGDIDIGDDDFLRALAMEAIAQRLSDALGTAGDDNDFSRNLHGASQCVSRKAGVVRRLASAVVCCYDSRFESDSDNK